MPDWVIPVVVTFLSSSVVAVLATLYFTREKTAAETKEIGARAAGEEIDTQQSIGELLKRNQDDIARLYTENGKLLKDKAEADQKVATLLDRLRERDAQLSTFRKLADESKIIQTVTDQMGTLNAMMGNLEKARADAQEMLKETNAQVSRLVETNRDLTLKRPNQS